MTDARLPGRWLLDRRINALSDGAWRLHTYAMMWSGENRTDGRVEEPDLESLPRCVDPRRVHELVDAGLWERDGNTAWLIRGWARTQTTALQLEAADRAREADRRRKAEARAKKAAEDLSATPSKGAKSADVSDRTSERKSGRDAQDRPVLVPGQASTASNSKSYVSSKISTDVEEQERQADWPAVPIPGQPRVEDWADSLYLNEA